MGAPDHDSPEDSVRASVSGECEGAGCEPPELNEYIASLLIELERMALASKQVRLLYFLRRAREAAETPEE